MKISIVLAAYQGERFIKAQLSSIAAQTRQPDEVLIADDCSDDATADIAQAFAQGREGWRVIRRTQNGGYKRNFYDLMRLADGDIIFLCDQDDVWEAQKLERFAAFFEAQAQAQAVVSDYTPVDAQLTPIQGAQSADFASRYGLLPDGRLSLLRRDPLLFAHGSVAPGCCMAVTRAVRDRYVQISTCTMPHDWEMAIIADAMDGLFAIDEKLTLYRQHGANEIGLAAGRRPLKMRGSMQKRLEVHGHFEAATHAMACCAAEIVGEKTLRAMREYAAARRAFLENATPWRLAKVYRYYAVYARAIDLRGRLGDVRIAFVK